ncbi:MAG: P-II family nitrogen regulator [Thermoproteota archaeon]|nr:P-II family nitrogen regulator [Thermoproteota archaeon]
MKELSIIIPRERLNDINSLLYKHKVGGVYFFEIAGRGRAERSVVESTTIEGYRTGKKYVPEFGSRTMVQVIVPDSLENVLISDIMEKISTGSAGDGKIFVKDVTGAYDIGSKEAGDKAAL